VLRSELELGGCASIHTSSRAGTELGLATEGCVAGLVRERERAMSVMKKAWRVCDIRTGAWGWSPVDANEGAEEDDDDDDGDERGKGKGV